MIKFDYAGLVQRLDLCYGGGILRIRPSMNFNPGDWRDRRDFMKHLTQPTESGSDIYNLNDFFQIQSMGIIELNDPLNSCQYLKFSRHSTLPG